MQLILLRDIKIHRKGTLKKTNIFIYPMLSYRIKITLPHLLVASKQI